MSEPFIPAALSSLAAAAQAGGLSGLRFIPPGTLTPHDGVVYRSRGVVLVIGDSPAAVAAARELSARAPKLRIALFVPGVGSQQDLPSSITPVGGRIVSLEGHLGQFTAAVRVAVDKVEDAGIFSANADRRFDLVLDLCREPLLRQEVPPYGYYAPRGDAAATVRALDSLPQLTGDFFKPGYVALRPQLCTHESMGVAGCRRCLDVCATEAIQSKGERIEIDPYRCQGCASCALVCPTGALTFLQPAPGALSHRLDELLTERARGGKPCVLVVHDAATRHLLPSLDESSALLEVDPLPAFSDVLWMTALTRGASGVVLAIAPTTPAKSRLLLEQRLRELREILASVGGNPATLEIASATDVEPAVDRVWHAASPLARTAVVKHATGNERRAGFLDLVDAYAAGDLAGGGSIRAEPCALQPGAAFGAVAIDPVKCTICHACTHLCPTGALSGQLDLAPRVLFMESLCVQCNLCRAGCPEQAISLQARFLPDAEARQTPRELARDQFVACRGCGIPFIGQRKLAMSLALMESHAKDMPGGIDSLRMCPDCRRREPDGV